jgi:hypothetical protein
VIAEYQAVRPGHVRRRVTSTSWPMSDASIRLIPLTEAPRNTMEYSISLSKRRAGPACASGLPMGQVTGG